MIEELSKQYQPDSNNFGQGARGCYLDIAIENHYSGRMLENMAVNLVHSNFALLGSRFTPLARRRYRLTGRFNAVILGELLDDLGMEFSVSVYPEGFVGKIISGSERLPYDSQRRDGDLIDNINFTVLKRRFERRKSRKKKNG